MNKNTLNDYKRILTLNFITIGTIAITNVLTIIGWSTTFRLENWHGYLSWALHLFGVFSPFYNIFVVAFFMKRALKKRKKENWKDEEISTNFWNNSNIFLNIICMSISFLWLIQGSSFFLSKNLIQAIFMIVISVFSLIYISHYFYW